MRKLVSLSHKAEHYAHATYFAFVALEAHGTYGIAAAACLVFLLINMFAAE